jgi:hypothetical protein
MPLFLGVFLERFVKIVCIATVDPFRAIDLFDGKFLFFNGLVDFLAGACPSVGFGVTLLAISVVSCFNQ